MPSLLGHFVHLILYGEIPCGVPYPRMAPAEGRFVYAIAQ